MAVAGFDDLVFHASHAIEIGVYGPPDDPWNVAIECMTCNEVLVDFDKGDNGG